MSNDKCTHVLFKQIPSLQNLSSVFFLLTTGKSCFHLYLVHTTCNVSVKSKLQHPPPPGIPRAFDAFSCPVGRAFISPLIGGGEFENLIASLDVMLQVALIPRGLINHGGDGGDKF